MAKIAEKLEASGFSTFLPQRDGLELAKLGPYLVDRGYDIKQVGRWLNQAIDALDCYQVIDRCGSIVAVTAGRTPDEGLVAEVAMAWLAGKATLKYTDGECRTLIGDSDNPLVDGRTGFTAATNLDEIVPQLCERIRQVEAEVRRPLPLQPDVARKLLLGEKIWIAIEKLNATPEILAEDRIKELGSLLVALFNNQG